MNDNLFDEINYLCRPKFPGIELLNIIPPLSFNIFFRRNKILKLNGRVSLILCLMGDIH